MTLGNPPMPARHGGLVNASADIYTMSVATGNGGVGYGTYSLAYSNIPCTFQTMSTSESQRWGSLSEQTLYEAYIPVQSMDGTDITVTSSGSAWRLRIGGVTYEAIGAGVLQSDGLQKVALRRVSG